MKAKKNTPAMIMILDGFGENPSPYGNAILAANTPNLDALKAKYPHKTLEASGPAVGLPEGQMGNSEVGHMNIGAGRIVFQDLLKISNSIDDHSFETNEKILSTVKEGETLHVMGLLSDGGVHSHISHLKAIIKTAKAQKVKNLYLHAFLDGRDVPPKSALEYMTDIEDFMKEEGIGEIKTVSGRYYAMDRDSRWERLQLAYDALVNSKGQVAKTAATAVENAYKDATTDEFVVPCVIGDPVSIIPGDNVFFYNFRPDRAREITRALVDPEFKGFNTKPLNLNFLCMTTYDEAMPNVKVAFPPEFPKNTLGEYLSSNGYTQLRIAETEKYAHVTFFFNGRHEAPHSGEERILIKSPAVPTYDLQPEMSAYEVTSTVISKIKNDDFNVYILNFANPDMVGHTGNFDAAVKAIEAIDKCVGEITKAILEKDGQILLTADHGNADTMKNEDGEPITSHSLNVVPIIIISNDPPVLRSNGKLADIAPTFLKMLNLKIPKEMSGNCLI